MLTFWRRKFFIKSIMTSKVIKIHKQWPFYLKIHFFFCLCYWLIEETNAAEHYESTKFDLYKDDIFPALTWTYVLMDNFLSLFYLIFTLFNKGVKERKNKIYFIAKLVNVGGLLIRMLGYLYKVIQHIMYIVYTYIF